MRRSISRSIAAVLVSGFLLSSVSSPKAAVETKLQVAASPYDLINAVNVLRVSYGLAAYSVDATLMTVAQAHADYMAATGNVSHTGLGGTTLTERLLAAGYPLAGDLSLGGFRSENITSGNEMKTAQDAVNGWTGDALHLNTMISPNLTEIGAGVSVNNGRVYFVIDCALPTDSGVPQSAAVTAVAGGPTVVPGGGVIIPVQVVTPNGEGNVIHEVKAGQTLWQIAISYETKIEEIKRLNNRYDNSIYPGEKLLIRQGVLVSTATPIPTATSGFIAPSTALPMRTATLEWSSPTVTVSAAPTHVSTNQIMSITIGIVALALLGVLFVLADSKPTHSKTKE